MCHKMSFVSLKMMCNKQNQPNITSLMENVHVENTGCYMQNLWHVENPLKHCTLRWPFIHSVNFTWMYTMNISVLTYEKIRRKWEPLQLYTRVFLSLICSLDSWWQLENCNMQNIWSYNARYAPEACDLPICTLTIDVQNEKTMGVNQTLLLQQREH